MSRNRKHNYKFECVLLNKLKPAFIQLLNRQDTFMKFLCVGQLLWCNFRIALDIKGSTTYLHVQFKYRQPFSNSLSFPAKYCSRHSYNEDKDRSRYACVDSCLTTLRVSINVFQNLLGEQKTTCHWVIIFFSYLFLYQKRVY